MRETPPTSPLTSHPLEGLEALRSRLGGEALTPEDPGYPTACTLWNAMIERQPQLIVRCDDVSDVQECVRFARTHALPLSVRGGGHNIGGRALADGGVVVYQGHRRGVRIEGERVVVEPGATLGDLDAGTLPHGRVVPSGIVSATGIAGLTLGGGFGWLSRRWGLTCDHLEAVDLVTATGEAVRVDADSHPELLWALRGGGGGLGVVTTFHFRSHRLDHEVLAGVVFHRDAEAAFRRFRSRERNRPEELTCLLKLGAAPAAPFLEADLHGQPCAATIGCHSGDDLEQAATDLAPLRIGPGLAADLFEPRRFGQFQAMFDAGEPDGRRNYWKSEYIGELDDELQAILLRALQQLPSPAANIKVFELGGAVARVSAQHSAAGHRDARYIVVIATAWTDPSEDEANLRWVRDFWTQVHARSQRGGYVNFLTEDSDESERRGASGGVDLERLHRVRRTWNPDGLLG